MINNDVLRALRYMLDLSEPRLAGLVALAAPGLVPDRDAVRAFLGRDGEEGTALLGDALLAAFLDGLILERRGRDDAHPPRAPERHLGNNRILKKLRVAFELKDADMHAILEAAGFPLSKPEMSALFRQPGHKNYRPCGDQLLRYFLKGLTVRVRGGGSGSDPGA